jgi:hypothetical protein
MTPEQVFLKLVHGVADRDFAVLPELYAEQTDVRHPMNPYGDHPLLSRDALREHLASARGSPRWCASSPTTSASTRRRTPR